MGNFKPKRRGHMNLGANLPRFLSTEMAAYLMDLAPFTLAKWRRAGQGPPFIRVSHNCIRYDLEDLLQFMETLKEGNLGQTGAEGQG